MESAPLIALYMITRLLKISLVATVLNEGRAMRPWLEALRLQTRQPDEIVICDGGSKDGTLAMLEMFAHEHSAPPLRVISKPGANIAAGRNAAIAVATGEIIAITDAGSLPNPDWLAEILKPFDTDHAAQIVAGSYRFLEDTRFRRAASAYLGKPWKSSNFNPSARSVAFTKATWESVGG
ncbi:MAG: glycosyltransferase, partial [Planctomycetota bacterium]